MQVDQICQPVSLAFDEPNLLGTAGLLPVMRLAETAGLSRLVGQHLHLPGDTGAHPEAKVAAVVAGMLAGADSIDDMALLRHGAMDRVFGWSPAPSTIGSFLRTFTHGHVAQLQAVSARLLQALTATTPLLVDRPAGAASEAGVETAAGSAGRLLVDVDDTVVEVHGHAKQGASFGYTKIRGLNAILATVTAPERAPVIVGSRLRQGKTNSVRGIDNFIRSALAQTTRLAPDARVLVRADSAFFTASTVAPVLVAGAAVSVTVKSNPAVSKAIASIPATAWTPITYQHPVVDPETGQPVTSAEVAEVAFTAFRGHHPTGRVPGRLVVRRVVAFAPRGTTLFDYYRYHAFFTTVPIAEADTITADRIHRAHAIIEQVNADLKGGPLAHLPSGRFAANEAWLTCAVIAYNLARAAGTIADGAFTRATTATIRARLILVPARIANSGRRLTVHLPRGWPWQTQFLALHPPPATCPA